MAGNHLGRRTALENSAIEVLAKFCFALLLSSRGGCGAINLSWYISVSSVLS